jgi:hypothetical protein
MAKESFKRPTTEVFKKDAEKNLLGKGKDWCNPKNLPEIRKTEEFLKKENVEIKYDSGQYLVNNLWLLLGKTSLDAKARTLMHHEIRAAWDSAIDEVHNEDGKDPYGFKEKKVYNLYWLSSRFKLPGKCKKLQLKDGEIRFLDKDGKAILSFSLDLKSSARKIAESEEMIAACKDERKEKGKKVAEKIAEDTAPDVEILPGELDEPGDAEAQSEAVKPAEGLGPVEPAELVSELRPVEPAKLVSELGPVEPKDSWFLTDKVRDFSKGVIDSAKLQKQLRPAETAEAGRSDKREEETAKLFEAARPIEPVMPAEAAKPAEFPAPKGSARAAETSESARDGRPIEAVAARAAEAGGGSARGRRGTEAAKPKEVAKAKRKTLPVKLVKVVAPVKVARPIEPAKPVEPVKPVGVVEAVKPAETAKPAEIAKPVEFVKPAEVAEPVEPEEEKLEPAGNVEVKLPPEILPLLNRNGRFSLIILGGRKGGEGGGAGLFDTMKQVVFDPASKKLVVISYSRDAYLPDGKKLNHAVTKNPETAQKVLGGLSGEVAPFYLHIGLKEAVEIFDIIISDITGPIKIDLPANYVVDGGTNGTHYFPKKTVIKNGNTMLAFLQFRHGFIVPDGYTGSFSEAKAKGYPTVGADDSYRDAASRMARQEMGLMAIVEALTGKVSGLGKFELIAKYGLAIREIQGIVAENTNLPISLTDFDGIQGLMALGRIFRHGETKKESLTYHYGKDNTGGKAGELKEKLRSMIPTNIAFYEQIAKARK